MGRVGRGQLAKIVSEHSGVPESTVRRVLSQVFTAITEELAKGNSVTMTGFGTWRTKIYTPRTGRNPQDGSSIEIPARTRVVFKTGSKLRSRVEHSIDPEIFFGDGIAEATELEGALAHLFGATPETFHLEEATARIREVLGADSEREAEEFFTALCTDLQMVEALQNEESRESAAVEEAVDDAGDAAVDDEFTD